VSTKTEVNQGRRLGLPPWLLMALPLFASAASHGLWAPDEPRYGQVAREVFSGGGGLAMHLNGSLYPDKPPLLFWAAGLLGWLTGWSELAMRLVSILATLMTAHLVGVLAMRWWRPREASWAPAFFLGTVMVTEIGGRLQIDPLLTLLTTLALVLLDGHKSRWTLRLAGLVIGLGVLAKGPVAILIPVLVWLAWQLIPAARRAGEKPSLRATLLDPWTILLALLPAGLWAMAAIQSEPALKGPLLYGQHLGRITSGGSGKHWAPPWQHLLWLPVLVLPWTLPFLAGLWDGCRSARRGVHADVDRGLVRAVAWFAVLFLFFSIIPPKRNLYLLPAYPAIALICARWWNAILVPGNASERTRSLARMARLSSSAFLVVLGMFLMGVGAFASFWDLPIDLAERLAELPGLRASAYWRFGLPGLIFTIGGVAGMRSLGGGAVQSKAQGIAWEVEQASALRKLQSQAGLATLGSWSLGACALFALLMPMLDSVKSARHLATVVGVLHQANPAQSILCLGIKPEGLRFYADVPAVSWADLPSAGLPDGLFDLPSGAVRDLSLLEHWQVKEGASFLAILKESIWQRLAAADRAQFRLLVTTRLGSKRVVVIGPG
jgi:4-amino-4-deoxy-L-arabinose transferase-like glycosyltransferase